MPIIKSAKKRVRVANKAAVRNSKTKRSLKSAIKAFTSALKTGKDAKKLESKAASELDIAVKKGILHKNKVARKKRQLAKAAKTAATAAPVKKAAAKKPATKKTTAKKK
ncbi:MAG TPA: 30S ribosomal protein S20 [Candidatus Saccharimonadales bacterium]|nr:30S ribosomal protein S20 [Candidatus Saccharimonadales bacterium]